LVKENVKTITKPVNFTLDSQKITFDFLKSHLWSAADILRGSLDPSEYRQPVMTLLFLKRLNDTFEENVEKMIKGGKSKTEAYENRRRHYFFVPPNARWLVLSSAAENIGEKIDDVCRLIERENKDLEGVLTNTKLEWTPFFGNTFSIIWCVLLTNIYHLCLLFRYYIFNSFHSMMLLFPF
jgi:hypothetical protein